MSSSTLNNINSNGVSLRLNPNNSQNIELGNGGGNILLSSILSSSSSINSTSVTTGSINTLGGIGISLDTVIGGHLYIGQTGITGERTLLIENDSSNSAAFAALRLTNNTAAGLVAFINSSAKTTDGGVNNATIRNDAGALNLQGSGGSGINISTAGVVNIANLTASQAVFTDGSKNLVSVATTGSGSVVLATSPTLVTPVLGAATGTSLSVTGMITNGGFDFYLGTTDQASRGNSGTSRAMVKDVGNILYVNYESDYTGGTRLGGPVILSGNRSGASSVTDGQYLRLTGGTYTDTGVAGTRATSVLNSVGAPVLASTNTVTVTDAINLRIAGGPTAGTNTTITNSFGLWNQGRTRLVGRTEITDTTSSTSSTTGALTLGGGLGVAQSLFVGTAINLNSLTTSLPVVTDGSKNLISATVTGTGTTVVLATSPTLVTPVLGAATGTSLNLSSLTASLPVVTDGSKNLISATVTGTGTTVVLATSPTLVTPVLGAATGTSLNLSSLTASQAVFTDGSKNLVSVATTGSGSVVLATSPTLVTPVLGAATATSITTTTATVNDYYEVTNVTTPGSATAGKQRFYVDTADSLLKSKNSSGTVTTYQPITTKGDLVSRDTTTQGRVPVGTDGQVLIADSTQIFGLRWGSAGAVTSHATLTGLASDDHTQYALLAGRSGGQTLTGGTVASNNLTLRSTTNATKGSVIIDETTVSTSSTTGALRVGGGLGVAQSLFVGTAINLNSLTASLPVVTDGSKNLISATVTGTGTTVVLATSPTLVTPVLGAATGTSLNLSSLTASLPVVTDGSKNLISATVTGTGTTVVLATSPTLVTPVLGAATGTSLNLSSLTASQAVFTDGSKNLVSVATTGSGSVVLATSPTLVTPVLGAATGTSLSVTGMITNGGFDFYLGTTDQASRGNSGTSRAMVKDVGNILYVNYESDYTGGTRLGGPVILSGNRSGASSVTDGQYLRLTGGTYTDTGVAGTRATSVLNSVGAPVLASTNAVTVTDAINLRIAGGPTAGTNTTITNSFGLWNQGRTRLVGRTEITDTTASTSSTTGALTLGGGLGVAQSLFVGTAINLNSLTTSLPVVTDGSKNLISATVTGTGTTVVLATSPTLVTPVLGAATGTSLNLSSLTASLPVVTDGSKNLISATVTGTGTTVVLATSPTLVTPVLGAATGTSLNLSSLTASLPVVTDGSKNLISATVTGTGTTVVLATSPTLVTPVLGAATGTSLDLTGTTSIGNATSLTSALGVLNTAGDFVLYNATKNTIAFRGAGVAAPSLTTRSNGTKIVLFPDLSGTNVDYGIGIESNSVWYSAGPTNGAHKFYSSNVNTVTIGQSLASSSSTTGTLVVSGGLGISNTTDAVTSTNGGSFTTAGGMAVTKSLLTGGKVHVGVDNPVDGVRELFVYNVSTGTSAMSNVKLINSAGSLSIFLNSSTKTTDGGVNNATIRNEVGALNLQGSGSTGINISTAGVVNIANLTASLPVVTDGSKNLVSATVTGTGTTVVLATSPTLVTPVLGAATGTSINLTGNLVNGGFDFVLGNTDQISRGNSGGSRAIVKDVGNILYFNYESDYTGGTRIGWPILSNGTQASTSSTTGTMRLNGGIGINNTTDASSSTNGGSFTTAGGMAVAKDLYIGGILNLPGTRSSVAPTTALGQYLRLSSGTYTAADIPGTSLLVSNSIGRITYNSTTPLAAAADAATLYIQGTPIAGTNVTISNLYGLWSEGMTKLGGNLVLGTSTDTSRLISALDSAQAVSTKRYITFGKENSIRNQAELAFHYANPGSVANYVGIGLNGSETVKIYSTTGVDQTGVEWIYADAGQQDVSAFNTYTIHMILSGNLRATGFYATSDIRIKEKIETINDTSIEDLRPVSYYYIDKRATKQKQYGFIAQEVEQIFPDAVIKEHTYLPNIRKFVEKTGTRTFKLKNFDIEVGKELQVYITKENDESCKDKEEQCKIVSKNGDEYTINIDFDKIFVYGTYENDVRSIKYENFIPLLVADNQKKTKQITQLQTELDDLKAKVELLLQKI